MSALAVPHPVRTHPGVPAPAGAPRRRGHLQLVGPGFVPAAPARAPERAEVDSPLAAAAPATIRLTARGRLVRSFLSLVLGMLLAVGVGSWLGSLGGTEHAGSLEPVNVAAGDTLWTIAAATAGAGQDVRDIVEDIVQINGLASAEVAAGQQILVPAG